MLNVRHGNFGALPSLCLLVPITNQAVALMVSVIMNANAYGCIYASFSNFLSLMFKYFI